MRSTMLITAGLGLVLAMPALAQSSGSAQQSSPNPGTNTTEQQAQNSGQSNSGQSNSGQSSSGQANPAFQQAMKKDLEQAGFTDVKIMPESFLIRAHDKQGRPVMMVVNPDSIVAMTKMGSAGNANTGNANTGNANESGNASANLAAPSGSNNSGTASTTPKMTGQAHASSTSSNGTGSTSTTQ